MRLANITGPAAGVPPLGAAARLQGVREQPLDHGGQGKVARDRDAQEHGDAAATTPVIPRFPATVAQRAGTRGHRG
jgi:hypothetical protein